jgi:hypothetical protein
MEPLQALTLMKLQLAGSRQHRGSGAAWSSNPGTFYPTWRQRLATAKRALGRASGLASAGTRGGAGPRPSSSAATWVTTRRGTTGLLPARAAERP